ncbi:serine hydrolase domain-containing protein [Flavihumibacter fluvii]|uniref:serine hydrolase domain-containing protein n=1 Tax=Flavihumibacter fluvii TaxID=2838157 RepID=UPI001BDE886D|nr:serine hydrolase domain-containing protein [Flavihumibacter fluvii]ULQ52091.1 beta-lactamase family protein [Flavihumibacter fluvii]
MSFRSFLLFIVTVIGSLCFSLSSSCQPANAEAGIRAIMQQQKVMGLSVAVVKKNKIIYTHSFGLKDMESNTPLTDDCIFRIASISKSFSATSIMQLVRAKKVSLEDDMSKLVGFTIRNPKFPGTVITLRHVMSHRSSINDSQGYFTLDAINPAKNPDWAKCFNDYEPGKGYMYCNLNYNMVGTIIEKFSGERFDQYVKHHVLDPLGLYGGYCVDSLDKSRFATIYEYNVDSAKFSASPAAYAPRREEIANYAMGYSTPIFSPTGGMKISATDLAQYMIMHMNMGRYHGKRIIRKKYAEQMQAPLSEEEGYGLAIMTTDKLIPGKTMKGHTGSAYGLYSAMFFHPKEKFGIVVISNGCDPAYTDGFNTVIRETVNVLYKDLIF